MSVCSLTLLFSLVASTAGLANNVALSASNFAKSVQFKHRLRICNAYPDAAGLDVFKGRDRDTKENIRMFRGQLKLTALPLEYKMCGDFAAPLLAGDKLKFLVGGARAGTFEVSDLPNNDAVLLIVIHRHDALTSAVAFQSHVFANLLNAQLAAIDTYKGRAHGVTEITSIQKKTETVQYNQVLALHPGQYQVSLLDNQKKKTAGENLVALNRESYIILRVGVDSQHGLKYPEEIVVYPASDPALLHSKAPRSAVQVLLLLAVFAMPTQRQ